MIRWKLIDEEAKSYNLVLLHNPAWAEAYDPFQTGWWNADTENWEINGYMELDPDDKEMMPTHYASLNTPESEQEQVEKAALELVKQIFGEQYYHYCGVATNPKEIWIFLYKKCPNLVILEEYKGYKVISKYTGIAKAL